MEFFNAASVVLKYFIQVNIIVTFCIILVFAVRFLVRKYSRLFSCCAWGIVGFGLVYFIVSPLQLPFHEIYSFLSVKLGLSYTPMFVDATGPTATSGSTAAGNVVPESPILSGEGMTGGDLSDKFTAVSSDFPQASGVPEWTQDIRFAQIFSFVWLAGILIFLIHFFYSYLRIKRQTRFAIRLRENIFEMDGCLSPFVYGLFPVRIYLPYGLNEEERSLVVAHEQCHIKYGHPVILLLAKWIRILFWINPLVWIAYQKIRFDLEMFCDEYTTKKLSISEKRAYSLLLVQMASTGKMTNVVSFSSRASVLKNRIKNILESKKGNIALPVCILILCLLIVAAGTSYAMGSSDLPSDQNHSGNGNISNGQTENAIVSQEEVDQKLTELGLQDSGISLVILNESGKILAQKGNIHEEVLPGSAARPLIAADILADGAVTWDSVVKGNYIPCSNEKGEIVTYPNWRREPEEMTFDQALANSSQVGLISAALNVDLSNLQNRLENRGFSDFDPTSEDSIASCILGQDMKISIYHLADAYYSIFQGGKNAQLRLLFKQDLQQQSQDYNEAADMSGSYGTGSEIVSGEPSIPGAVVEMDATVVYVGDYYLEDQRITIAMSRYYEDIDEQDVLGSNLVPIANALLISEETER